MRASSRLPARLLPGTKYVLEAQGAMVHRYVVFPDGHRVTLPARKALACCAADAPLVPKLGAAAEPQSAPLKHNAVRKRRSRAVV